MRPVDKGLAPRTYTDYKEAGRDLQQRLGDYCSYCERQVETHLATEHIQPKCHIPALRNRWDNFLLACVNCNSCKSDNDIAVRDYLWPDSDNTLLAMEYLRGGVVRVNPTMSATLQRKAQATITLLGLDKDPGNQERDRRPKDSDRRWLRRQQTWKLAELTRQKLLGNDSTDVRDLIVLCALGRGMFSIWWTVFSGDADMRRRLREAFLGTAANCFDANEELLSRPGGQV